MFLTSGTANNSFIIFIDLYKEPSFGFIFFLPYSSFYLFDLFSSLLTLLFTLGLTETFLLLRYRHSVLQSLPVLNVLQSTVWW